MHVSCINDTKLAGRKSSGNNRHGPAFCCIFWRGLARNIALAVFVLLAVAVPAGATEITVNTTTSGAEVHSQVAALPGGGLVVVWQARIGGDLGDIRAQLFDASGGRTGGEISVNTTTSDLQENPSVAALAGGGFIVAWADRSKTGADTQGRAVRARRFAASGAPAGPEFLVNTTFPNDQTFPSVTGLGNGGYAIVWEVQDSFGGVDLKARVFDVNDTAQGNEFAVFGQSLPQVKPKATARPNGGFTVTWSVATQLTSATIIEGGPVYFRHFDNAGAAQSSAQVANTTQTLAQFYSSVAELANGSTVVVWHNGPGSGNDGDSGAIRGRIFSSAGGGSEFTINTTTAGDQSFPRVAALSGGGFAVTWEDSSHAGDDASGMAVRAQRFDASGAKLGSELLVNTTITGDQSLPEIAVLASGKIAITWTDSGNDPSQANIKLDLFSPQASPTLFSSVLPAARSGFLVPGNGICANGSDVITVFETVINGGQSALQNCTISVPPVSPVCMTFQETDATNTPIGTANQPFALAAGQSRSFVLAFMPMATSSGADVFPNVGCDNSTIASIPGVNTVFLSIDDHPVPDILSIGATPDGNGIITVPANGASFMTASATNIGAGDAAGSSDAAVIVSVDDGGAGLPLLLQLCETDAAGTCKNPPGTAPVSTTIGSGASFIGVFVTDQASGGVPLDAAANRVFLRFTDASGTVRSVTSAAVTVP